MTGLRRQGAFDYSRIAPTARNAAAAAALGLLAAAAGAQTRPLQTEEATTALAHTFVLEAGADVMRDELNPVTGRRRHRWDMPVLRLVYSPADNVELDLEWTAGVGAWSDPDLGAVKDFGDVTLRAKLRVLGGGAGASALAVRFGVALPETIYDQGLGPNMLRMAAQVLGSTSLGGLRLHANAGLAIQDRPLAPRQQSDFLAYGLALAQGLGAGVEAVAEVAGLGVGAGAPGADRRSEARAGVRGGRGRLRWDLAVRRGLERADGTWGATAGFRWTLAPAARAARRR